jgi:hypothetical protein
MKWKFLQTKRNGEKEEGEKEEEEEETSSAVRHSTLISFIPTYAHF